MCKLNCSCLCKCKKEELDTKEFVELHASIKENNPRIRERRLAGAEARLLELTNNKRKYSKDSQNRIESLVEAAVKKRRFIDAWSRKNGKKYPSSHI